VKKITIFIHENNNISINKSKYYENCFFIALFKTTVFDGGDVCLLCITNNKNDWSACRNFYRKASTYGGG
jgi:hypothetical protein